jgi:hypothetical protein
MNSPFHRPYVFQRYINILRKTSIQRIIEEGLNDRDRWGLEPFIYLFMHLFIQGIYNIGTSNLHVKC